MNLGWVASIWLPLVALAAYRLTRLWVDDMIPPLPVLRRRLENRIQRRWDRKAVDHEYETGIYEYHGTPPLTYLLNCYWCAGFWITLAVVLAVTFLPLWLWSLPVLALALSAAVGLLAQFTD